MTDKELLEKIKRSAKQIEVPESLSPENILEKCRKTEQEKGTDEEKERKKFRFGNPKLIGGLSAAAVFVICCISLRGMMSNQAGSVSDKSAAATAEESVMEECEDAAAIETAEEAPAAGDAGSEENAIERKNAGNLYTLASGYDAVYEKLEEIKEERNRSDNGAYTSGMMREDADGVEYAAADTGSAFIENLKAERKEASAEKGESYSETNVQTFGIDESDVVKTDGEYLYLLRGSSVSIVSTGEEMKQVGEIRPEGVDSAATVCAMYVDGEKLVLMVQEYSASLEEKESGDEAYYDMLYIDEGQSVSVLTYDISNKKKPVLLGKVTQDGSYVTSRKDGNIVYLFTSQYLLEDYEKNKTDAIPEVNARKVAEDCIYIGEQGELALVENLQREDLNPIEEALGYKTLMEDYGMTQEAAAEAVGKSRPAVANALRLLHLSEPVLRQVESGALSAGHARALLPIRDPAVQAAAAETVVSQRLSVRQAESLAARLSKSPPQAEPAPAPVVDYTRELERELEGLLGRKVKLVDGKKKGRIELEFYGAQDREALIENLRLFSSLRRNK